MKELNKIPNKAYAPEITIYSKNDYQRGSKPVNIF